MDNNKYKCNQIKTKCENKLNITFRDGGEFNGWYLRDGKKFARITISHGKKNPYLKTYKSMATQLLLEVSEFDSFLKCTINEKEYLEITANRNIDTFKK